MLHVSGHLRKVRREDGYEDLSAPLVINCCGFEKFFSRDYIRQRPRGRVDYQLLYVYKGNGSYKIRRDFAPRPAGSVILYRPGEPQFYSYFHRDNPEIYWIHFTGNECQGILVRYGIDTCYVGESLQIKQIFEEIIRELQLKKDYYQSVAEHDFLKLLALIGRMKKQGGKTQSYPVIDELILALNQRYMESWSLKAMAEFCCLSPDYFSHVFKQAAGAPPIQYLNRLRVEKARELLIFEGISVSAAAFLTGFRDPLYFSRVFKRFTGISPEGCRKNKVGFSSILSPEGSRGYCGVDVRF